MLLLCIIYWSAQPWSQPFEMTLNFHKVNLGICKVCRMGIALVLERRSRWYPECLKKQMQGSSKLMSSTLQHVFSPFCLFLCWKIVQTPVASCWKATFGQWSKWKLKGFAGEKKQLKSCSCYLEYLTFSLHGWGKFYCAPSGPGRWERGCIRHILEHTVCKTCMALHLTASDTFSNISKHPAVIWPLLKTSATFF